MSILIKGMKMPKSCLNCKFTKEKFSSLGRFVNCRLGLGDVVGYSTGQHVNDRHPDCPIVEIPEKHGRLIDAEELIETAEFYETEMDIKNHSKTVIEAEGE